MLPSVVLTGAGSPLPFSHEVLVGRSALSVTAPCACNDIPDPSEAAQTADQYRVLSVLPLILPTSRIQDNKQTTTDTPTPSAILSCVCYVQFEVLDCGRR